jgi:hypothetical protein
VFEENGWLALKEHPTPSLERDTDALIKVTGVGVYAKDEAFDVF